MRSKTVKRHPMAEYICPHCNNPVYDDEALLCLYCGESLKRKVGFIGRMKHINTKALAVVLLLVLLSFILLVIR